MRNNVVDGKSPKRAGKDARRVLPLPTLWLEAFRLRGPLVALVPLDRDVAVPPELLVRDDDPAVLSGAFLPALLPRHTMFEDGTLWGRAFLFDVGILLLDDNEVLRRQRPRFLVATAFHPH